jgi:hypothetical protein
VLAPAGNYAAPGKFSAVFNFIQTHPHHERRLFFGVEPLSQSDRTAFQLLLFRPASEKGHFGLAPSKSAGRGTMLTQQSPSAITTKMLCPVCGGCLRLTVVEPHYSGKRLDNHIFACSACKEIQTYVFNRTLSVSCLHPL